MGDIAILGPDSRPISPEAIDRIRLQASQQATEGFAYRGAYRAGSFDLAETAAWWPETLSADRSILEDKDLSVARVQDTVRNNPTARAAVDRLVDMVVGAGLRLSARPDAMALGMDQDQAHELGRQMEAEWRLFGEDPRRTNDAQRRLSMNGQFRLAARTWITIGEATAVLTWRRQKGVRYATCLQAVSPARLSNPFLGMNTRTLRGGVELDAFGAPVAYHVRNAHQSDYWALSDAFTWTRVPRATSWGRPVFVHAFEPEGEDQTRGMTPFASLVTRLNMIGKFADMELAAATANALLTAFVESPLPAAQAALSLSPGAAGMGGITAAPTDYSDRIVQHFTRYPPKVNGVRIPVMPPGTKITMNDTPRQTTAFPAFQTAFLQSIASALGISYEQLSMDWTKTNYSSARAALNEVWRTIRRMSAQFIEQFVIPIYCAVMEEAFDQGFIRFAGAPGMGHHGSPGFDFWDRPGALLRSRWIGPPRGYVDVVKEGEGAAIRMESLTSTLEKESAEQGEDWEDNIHQIARENKILAEQGLSRMSLVAVVQASKGPKPDSEEAEGPAGLEGDATGKAAG